MKRIIFYCILGFPFRTSAQTIEHQYPSRPDRWLPLDYQYTTALNFYKPRLLSWDQMTPIAREAAHLPPVGNDISKFIRRTSNLRGAEAGFSLQASAGFQPFRNREGNRNTHRSLRFGLDYRTLVPFESSYTNTIDAGADTTFSRDITLYYRAKLLSVEAALLFQSDPLKQVHVFAGLGIRPGIALNSSIERQYSTSIIVRDTLGNTTTTFTDEVSAHAAGAMFGLAAFIPAGIHIRLFTSEFWRNCVTPT